MYVCMCISVCVSVCVYIYQLSAIAISEDYTHLKQFSVDEMLRFLSMLLFWVGERLYHTYFFTNKWVSAWEIRIPQIHTCMQQGLWLWRRMKCFIAKQKLYRHGSYAAGIRSAPTKRHRPKPHGDLEIALIRYLIPIPMKRKRKKSRRPFRLREHRHLMWMSWR